MFSCSGESVTIVWRYVLDPGDVLQYKEFMYHGLSEESIATEVHGHEFVSPSYSHRVQVNF